MNHSKHKTDYQMIAEQFGVTVHAVQQALKRRSTFPNNRLLRAYDLMQAAKTRAVQQPGTDNFPQPSQN